MCCFSLAPYALNFREIFLDYFFTYFSPFIFSFRTFCYLDIAFPDPLIFMYFPIFNIIALLYSGKFCQLYFSNSSIQFFICYLLIFKNFHLFFECSFFLKNSILFLFHGFSIFLSEDTNDFFPP